MASGKNKKTRKASGTVHGTKQVPIHGMLKENAGLKYELSAQSWMPMPNNGAVELSEGWSVGQRWWSGQNQRRERAGGELSPHSSPLFATWLGWAGNLVKAEVSNGWRRIIFPPTMHTLFGFSKTMIIKRTETSSTESGEKES